MAPPGTGQTSKSDEVILDKRGYDMGKKLGEGAYAKVYLCHYKGGKGKDPVKLACKCIDAGVAPSNFIRKFFPREIEVMLKVKHENVIRIHSILQRKHKFFVFMQFADKGDMLGFIQDHGGLKEIQAKKWYRQMAEGMNYMHHLKLCHRDLKCENLLLTANWLVKISDFGFARKFTGGKSKTFCGSPAYSPPEILHGIPYNALKADLWTMGVILYVMFSKSMPFDDTGMQKMYQNQMNRAWKLRPKVRDRLSPGARNFLNALLEPVPDKRLSCEQMLGHNWLKKGAGGGKRKGSGGRSKQSTAGRSKQSTAGRSKSSKQSTVGKKK